MLKLVLHDAKALVSILILFLVVIFVYVKEFIKNVLLDLQNFSVLCN